MIPDRNGKIRHSGTLAVPSDALKTAKESLACRMDIITKARDEFLALTSVTAHARACNALRVAPSLLRTYGT